MIDEWKATLTPAEDVAVALRQRVNLLPYWTPVVDGGRPTSQLWDVIATTKGPLRLHWCATYWPTTDAPFALSASW